MNGWNSWDLRLNLRYPCSLIGQCGALLELIRRTPYCVDIGLYIYTYTYIWPECILAESNQFACHLNSVMSNATGIFAPRMAAFAAFATWWPGLV